VLVEIGRDPAARIRDISAVVGLTERTVQVIVADLEAAGYLTRTRTGRRTRYTVNQDSLFRHPAQEGQRVGPFLSLFAAADENARTTPGPDDSEIGWQQTLSRSYGQFGRLFWGLTWAFTGLAGWRSDRKITSRKWARGSGPGPGAVVGPGQGRYGSGGLRRDGDGVAQ
jgi:hypothetical protein